jgi:hypothetical protein
MSLLGCEIKDPDSVQSGKIERGLRALKQPCPNQMVVDISLHVSALRYSRD